MCGRSMVSGHTRAASLAGLALLALLRAVTSALLLPHQRRVCPSAFLAPPSTTPSAPHFNGPRTHSKPLGTTAFRPPPLYRRGHELPAAQIDVDHGDIPGSTVVLRDKATGCTVYIVGCFHGSRASEQDVNVVFDKVDPGVVVLELCQERYNRMLAEMEARKNKSKKNALRLGQRMKRLGRAIGDFYMTHGLVQTFVTALLSSPSEMQRLMENGEPGCEFKAGIQRAQDRKAKLVLGDQDVEVTLARLKEGVMRSGWVLDNPVGQIRSLTEAVVGPPGMVPPKKVNLFRVLFTRGSMVKETVQSIGPVSVLFFLIADSLDKAVDTTWTSLATISNTANVDPAVSTFANVAMEMMEALGWLGTNAFLALFFLAVNRFILVERDNVLSESIHESCLKNRGSKVMAVVGLLHCNGVARHLREKGYE